MEHDETNQDEHRSAPREVPLEAAAPQAPGDPATEIPTGTAPPADEVTAPSPAATAAGPSDSPGASVTPVPPAAAHRGLRGPWVPIALVAALIGALVGGATGGLVGVLVADDDTATSPAARTAALPLVGTGDVREIVDAVGPAVVAIDTQTVSIDGFTTPFQDGAGSGFIISEDGVVITNNHVVAGATNITVTVADGRELSATVLGRDPSTDLAVLKVDADGLPVLPVGDSDALQVGDTVVAIGNALGLGSTPTVTTGIVSALDRTISAGQGVTLRNLIQTDAAINPGNSGGPLLNTRGEVVGVNTAIAGGAENIGFALAISSLDKTIAQLRSGEMPRQPFLGVSSMTVTEQVKQRLDLEVDEGALVLDVTPGSGADLAGISRGDVVLRVGDEGIATAEDLSEAISELDPGAEVEIELHRAGSERTVTVTIGERSGSLG